MWYMGLDKDNRPNGWDTTPWGNAIEVTQAEYDFASLHPEAIWNGTVLVLPPPPLEPVPAPPYIPSTISMRQCRLYLYDLDNGATLSAVEAYVTTTSMKAQIEYNSSAEVWRTSPMVEEMRVMFGWTIEQMDEMFVAAALL